MAPERLVDLLDVIFQSFSSKISQIFENLKNEPGRPEYASLVATRNALKALFCKRDGPPPGESTVVGNWSKIIRHLWISKNQNQNNHGKEKSQH